MIDRQQVVRVLGLAQEKGVVPGALHGVAGHDGPGERERGEQRPEVADLIRLAGLGDPVLGDDQARDVRDRREQVHLPAAALPRAPGLLAVHRDAATCRDVPRVPARGGVQPRMGRVRPEPAVLALLPEGHRSRRPAPPPLPPFPLLALLLLAVRGARGRDRGSSATAATAAVSAASSSSGSSRNLPSRSSIDADGASRSPVRGLTRQPCAASTSWSQPAAACATCSGP
jgi:hypothetical protein